MFQMGLLGSRHCYRISHCRVAGLLTGINSLNLVCTVTILLISSMIYILGKINISVLNFFSYILSRIFL